MRIIEIFRSVQGEGPLAGRHTIFLRLGKCNLNCIWCDSKYAWESGYDHTTKDIMDKLNEVGISNCKSLTITGGEPLLQAKEINKLLALYPPSLLVCIETNGTMYPGLKHTDDIHYIVSPKLSNSSCDEDARKVDPEFICMVHNGESVQFKFVVQDQKDMGEVLSWIEEHKIPRKYVWLMPQVITKDTHLEIFPKVFNWGLEYGLNVSPRLQVLAHDNKRGV